ncbi:MAG: hypothetical protein ABIY52_05615 [Gemmatimonadaceae bacterium]
MRSTSLMTTGIAVLAALAGALPASAQTMMPPTRITDAQVFGFLQSLPPESARSLGALVNGLLADTLGHMRMAERRVATRADTKRAAAAVRTMRSNLARYKDVSVAEQDGYALFLPWLKEQAVYHYNNMQNAGAARGAFDASKPTSLLYRGKPDGTKVLIGAMYTAPATSTPDELDARLPLGIAHWHEHVNFCAMSPYVAMAGMQAGDTSIFSKWLAVETQDACTAAGGMFIPQLFGWMTHVNAFAGDKASTIWGSHGRDQMHMHHAH